MHNAGVKQWQAENFLHLNEGKTECIILGDAPTSGFGTLTSKCQKP